MITTFFSSFFSNLSNIEWILFLTIITVLLVVAVALLAFYLRRKRLVKNRIETNIPANVWLGEHMLDMTVDAQSKTMFYLYQIDLFNADGIIKKQGSAGFKILTLKLCEKLLRSLPNNVVISFRGHKSILIYLNDSVDFDAEEVADKILKTAEEYKRKENLQVEFNVAAISYPIGGQDAKTLLSNLDTAMVASRRKSPGSYILYTGEIAIKEKSDYKYYQEISQAISAKEFTLFYQAIVDTETMEVIGVESLIRWKHRKLGILPPSNFLSIMEQTGDINWVGFWCFEEMIKQMAIWLPNCKNSFAVGINISEKQLMHPELSERLYDVAKKYNMDSAAVVIEINKFSSYSYEVVKTNINRLKEYGFKIVFDNLSINFKTGELEEYPLDMIKMDSRLWRKAKSKEIGDEINRLIGYCASNNIMLIAQGVEDKKDFEFLRSIGIRYMQGYAFAKPGEPQELLSLMSSKSWRELLLF